jgi:hypothetical protein
MRRSPLACALLALVGCEGYQHLSSVSGSLRGTFITERGEEGWVATPEGVEIDALAPRPTGDWPVMEGQIQQNGVFITEPMPSGDYYLRIRAQGGHWPSFFSMGTRVLEMNTVLLGRQEAVIPRQPTPLTIQATGMQPWSAGNQLHLFSLGAGAFDDDLEGLADLRLPETTENIAITVDSASFRQPGLVDAGLGDRVFITELAMQSQSRDGVRYLTPVRVFRTDPLVQSEGAPSTVQGAFEPIATSTFQMVNWKLGGFARAEPEVNPMARTKFHGLFFVADPAGPDRYGGGYPPQVLFSGIDATATQPITFPFTAEYRNPYPKEWALKFLAYAQYEVPWLPEALWPTVGSYGPLDEHTELQVVVTLGPPARLQLEGRDASGPVTGTGLTPALRWQAPATGKASLYEVLIYQQDAAGTFQLSGVVTTDRGDITVPPGVLRAGAPYVVEVIAYSNRDPGKPDQPRGSGAHAAAVTGLLTP